MARQRRTGGFRAPEIKGTLGTLLRSTLQQASVVRDVARDVLERGAREGRARIDDVRKDRRRSDALAELGEIVLELIRAGEIDPEELPEVREVVAQLDAMDGGRARRPDHDHDHDDHDHDHHDHEDPDDHDHHHHHRHEPREDRRVPPARRAMPLPERERDDGTVSATATTRKWPTQPPPKPAARVWRPVDEPPAPPEEERTRPPPFRAKTGSQPPPTRKGGISFEGDDDDADLADYMHPDDVPPKSDGNAGDP